MVNGLTEENVWNIRRQIGMVFQNPDNQFVGATVEDDVAFGFGKSGTFCQEMKREWKKLWTLVGMLTLKERASAFIGWPKATCGHCRCVALRP